MHKLILIEKDTPSSMWWENLRKSKRISNLSVEELVNKYQGFEGELVCFFDLKKNNSKIKEIINECLELKEIGNCLLLHVISQPDVMTNLLKKQALFVGYDIGVCEKEKTIYSSIFNEILFGYFDELVLYEDKLNENFLFPNRSLAEKYVNWHDQVSREGKGVEDYEEMIIYEIWKQNNKKV
jgi:hypothetical protein